MLIVKTILASVLFASIISVLYSADTQTITYTREPEPEVMTLGSSTAEKLIVAAQRKYGIHNNELLRTLKCESELKNPKEMDSDGMSYGIAQFHDLPSWGITVSQAMDERFAIDFAARSFKNGLASRWTCYRKIFE